MHTYKYTDPKPYTSAFYGY